MKLSDLSKVKPISDQLETLRWKYRHIEQARSLKIPEGDIELAEYDPPSQIGAAFISVRAALLNMLHEQMKALETALKAIGVDPD